MKIKNLIRHLNSHGCVMAKNVRPIKDILSMDAFLNLDQGDKYYLCGYIFGRPIFLKQKL